MIARSASKMFKTLVDGSGLTLDMIYYKLWQSFFSTCHECFREVRDSKQREQTVCHFLLLHSVYIVSRSFLREQN